MLGTLGLALLTAEANPVVETENSGTSVAGSGTSATTTKKVGYCLRPLNQNLSCLYFISLHHVILHCIQMFEIGDSNCL